MADFKSPENISKLLEASKEASRDAARIGAETARTAATQAKTAAKLAETGSQFTADVGSKAIKGAAETAAPAIKESQKAIGKEVVKYVRPPVPAVKATEKGLESAAKKALGKVSGAREKSIIKKGLKKILNNKELKKQFVAKGGGKLLGKLAGGALKVAGPLATLFTVLDSPEAGAGSDEFTPELIAQGKKFAEDPNSLNNPEDGESFPMEPLESEEFPPYKEGGVPFPIEDEPATMGDIDKAIDPKNRVPTKGEVLNEVSAIRNENTAVQAQQLALQEQIAEQRFMVDEAMEKMRNEDLELNAIDPDHFWSTKNTWQKIGLGIAMILGGAGGGNRAVDVVNNFINQDIAAQKLNNKQSLAKREEAYRRVTKELGRLESLTKDQSRIEQIQIAKGKLAQETMKTNQKRMAELQRLSFKDMVLKKGIKLESLTSQQRAAVLSKDDMKRADTLRAEYTKLTEKAGTREMVDSFRMMTDLVKGLQSGDLERGTVDIAVLTKFMKLIDPNSVVREGEFHIAETASPKSRWFQVQFNKLLGGKMDAKTRIGFVDTAGVIMKAKLKGQAKIDNDYRNLANKQGIPSSLIINDWKIKDASPREALWDIRKAKNPKLTRTVFNNSIQNLVKIGKLPSDF